MEKIVFEDNDVLVYFKEAGEDSEKIFPDLHVVSRLDKPVSGLLVFTKNKKASAFYSDPDTIGKTYYALVAGAVEPEGELTDLLLHDKRANKVFVVKRERKGVKEAKLRFRKLKEVDIEGEPFSLVEVNLITGRTHQIRVQFASRKHPLAGDGKYGSRVKGYIRLFCGSVDMKVSGQKEERHFEVPLPDDFCF